MHLDESHARLLFHTKKRVQLLVWHTIDGLPSDVPVCARVCAHTVWWGAPWAGQVDEFGAESGPLEVSESAWDGRSLWIGHIPVSDTSAAIHLSLVWAPSLPLTLCLPPLPDERDYPNRCC